MKDLIIDSFAGGGGASTGIEWAMGRGVDIAINHNAEALAMHRANHGHAEHYCKSVWQVDPMDAVRGNTTALAWFSPDCKHFSKAKGGKPVKANIRDLAWIVVLWAKRARPRVIMLENVEEFRQWGPVNQDGQPCKERAGQTFARWLGELRRLGYKIEHRELRAHDYGAPTIRKRLFLIARCDGEPIVWPEPTHGPGRAHPYRTAADIIDWSIPCHSIFLSKEEGREVGVKRPLAHNTMARIAKGVWRYAIKHPDPFIVPITHVGDSRVHGIDEPLRTVTTAHRGEFALAVPFVSRQFGKSVGSAIPEPVGTVTAGGGGKTALVVPSLVGVGGRMGQSGPRTPDAPYHTTTAKADTALVSAFLAQHNTGMTGHDAREPLSTIVQKGCTQALVHSHMISLKGSDRRGSATDAPAPSITAGGYHVGEVRAFLMKYYGEGGQWQDPRDPLHTLTAKARIGIVTVAGVDYRIVDIGMRMLTPRELFRAQGFPDSYIIDPEFNGKPLTKTAQIRMCGNSVCPQLAEALVRANLGDEAESVVAA